MTITAEKKRQHLTDNPRRKGEDPEMEVNCHLLQRISKHVRTDYGKVIIFMMDTIKLSQNDGNCEIIWIRL